MTDSIPSDSVVASGTVQTARIRIIPIGGENPYAKHPGFDAQGCHLQYTVTPAAYSSSYHGFGCEVNGGHCLPNDGCDKLRVRFPTSIRAEAA